MNRRIIELAEQADIVFGTDKNGDPEVICSVGDIEEFTRGIIRMCGTFTDPVTRNLMMNYFGVEE
tara:strand:+ start:2418 stop:2612 length:195 start_codon:yes stop_codon:yes gene_type:complete